MLERLRKVIESNHGENNAGVRVRTEDGTHETVVCSVLAADEVGIVYRQLESTDPSGLNPERFIPWTSIVHLHF